ncbi:MAG: CBS domain-containing protein, partial [Candidatus Sumerlaeota bacterium]
DYVAQFVENIDVAKVLNAGSIMKPVHDLAYIDDGPRVALRKMRRSAHSTLFVVDANRKLKGLVRAEALRDSVDKMETIESIVETDVRSVTPDTFLEEITLLMSESRDPVVVVDDDGRVQGVIVIGSLMSGLAEGATSK